MKLTFLLLTVTCLHLSARSYAQRVTLHKKNITLGKVFEQIYDQTGYQFVCTKDMLKEAKKVSLNVKNEPLRKVLEISFKGQPLSYTIRDKAIIVKRKNQQTTKEETLIPPIQVSGKVTDSLGNPLIGVTIKVKKGGAGTVTDGNGNYVITVPDDAVLVVSYVGYRTQEVPVDGKSEIDIVLKSSVSKLNQLVVVGYGEQEKKDLTGAISNISNKEITTTKNQDIVNSLTGKVPGLRVVQNSSEPGDFSDTRYNIRGMGTPLVVVDGVPRDNLERLDPNDIESISVLKDASAAIYGVRAANGVILVTTKEGKKGELQLDYSGYMGWQVPSGLPKPVDAIQYMTLFNEKMMNNVNGGHIAYTPDDFKPYENGTKKSTDWYSAVIKNTAPQMEHNLSASGGTDRIRYFASVGYTSQGSFFRSDDFNYKRYNVRSNISSQITKDLNVSLKLNAIMDRRNLTYQSAWWIIRSFWRQLPTQSFYANDNPNYPINTQVDGTNPISMSNADVDGYTHFDNKWFQSSISADYNVPWVDGLQLSGLFSYDYNMSDNKIFRKKYNNYIYDAANEVYNPIVKQAPSNLRREFFSQPSYLAHLSLHYQNTFGAHHVTGLLLYEESLRSKDNFFADRNLSIPVDQLLAGNSDDQEGYMNSVDLWQEANKGLVGRVSYDYEGKYLGQFSFRYDGSSKFYKSHQWGFFPSASVGWRISEENFWKNSTALSFIDNLKFRASYGKLGDDAASSYQFITGYTYPASGSANGLPPGSVFGDTFVNAVQNKGVPNKDITWFVSKTLDIGMDVDLWNGLLGITADIFRRDRSGLLATRILSLPDLVGASLPQENLNSDRTQGYEVELTHQNKIGRFNYFINGNIGYTRTRNMKVVRAKSGNSYEDWHNNSNGRWNDVWWGWDDAQRYQSYEDISTRNVFVERGNLPGDYAYLDWNGDGAIGDLDQHPIAYNGDPRINFGMTLGGSYQGFDLNLLFQGATMVNVSYIEQLRQPLWGGGSALEQFLSRWHPTDPTADPYDPNTKWISGEYAAMGGVDHPQGLPYINSFFNIHDGSYVRLKSIELGYTLPSRLTEKIGIKSTRVYLNAYNLLTLSAIKYVDPEHPSSTFGYIYPLNKTFNVGINIKF